MMVYDTLFALDEAGNPQPQMLAGHTVEEDGKTWTLTLRDGLLFHDGTPVLARVAVASIKRWGHAGRHSARRCWPPTDELSAPDDRTIQFRLKQRV